MTHEMSSSPSHPNARVYGGNQSYGLSSQLGGNGNMNMGMNAGPQGMNAKINF